MPGRDSMSRGRRLHRPPDILHVSWLPVGFCSWLRARSRQPLKSLPPTGPITRAIWPGPSIRRSIKSLPATSPSLYRRGPSASSRSSARQRHGKIGRSLCNSWRGAYRGIRRNAHRRQRRDVFARGQPRGGAGRSDRRGNLELRAASRSRVATRRRLLAGRQAKSAAHPVYCRPQT